MRTYRQLWTGLAVGLCLFALPLPAFADSQLHGTVTDASGAVITGATVRVVDPASGVARTTTTDDRGTFVLEGLPAGRYEVSTVSEGFAPATTAVVVLEDARERVALTLSVQPQRAVVDVYATAETAPDRFAHDRPRTSDSAWLLDGLPGLAVAASGGVSGVPSIHGLGGDRVKLNVDGMTLSPACSSHMNPPLSYLDPANLGSIKVMAGLTPVSAGGDSIGGSIAVETVRPEFAASGVAVRGGASIYTRTNSETAGGSATFSAATEHLRFGYVGSYVHAGNYAAGGGDVVKSTFYESANHALQLAVARGTQTVSAGLTLQRIPEQGFPNARMDMTRNDATTGNVRLESITGWGRIDARAYIERTRHQMNILRDKVPGMDMPMDTRGTNLGYTAAVDVRLGARDLVRLGSDLHRFALDEWWPPVMMMVGSMGPDTLLNINDGRRTRVGTYGEWEARRAAWTTLVGLRSDIVSMNTDDVAGYNMVPAATGSADYYADAVAFNARDRARRDYNVDATALARTRPSATTSLEIGYARKTRSPNLYERYLWVRRSNMAIQMNGWFGDGNGYTGDVDLRPEIAHTLSATAGWHSRGSRDREVTITPYVTRVNDFIDVDRCAVVPGSNGCTAAKLTATSGFVNLQFANHDARLYGADVSGRTRLGGSERIGTFTLAGVMTYVRGRLLDTGDNVYRLMPLDTRLSVEHVRKQWSSAFTAQHVAAKRDVQAARNELATSAYTLLGVRTGYAFKALRLDLGIDNLTDARYILPTAGRYWIGDPTGASGVPGLGRSFYIGLSARL